MMGIIFNEQAVLKAGAGSFLVRIGELRPGILKRM